LGLANGHFFSDRLVPNKISRPKSSSLLQKSLEENQNNPLKTFQTQETQMVKYQKEDEAYS